MYSMLPIGQKFQVKLAPGARRFSTRATVDKAGRTSRLSSTTFHMLREVSQFL